MEILAGSESVNTDSFLHAGYMSAYSETYERFVPNRPERPTENGNANLAEVKDAHAVKQDGEATAMQPTATVVKLAAPMPYSIPSGPHLAECCVLLMVVCFFALVAGAYCHRSKGVRNPGWRYRRAIRPPGRRHGVKADFGNERGRRIAVRRRHGAWGAVRRSPG